MLNYLVLQVHQFLMKMQLIVVREGEEASYKTTKTFSTRITRLYNYTRH
jgi:hypothetical protein